MTDRRVPDRILEEAADWAISLRFDADEDVRKGFERWRAQSPAHDEAWLRAESAFGPVDEVSSPLKNEMLGTLASGIGRRRALRTFIWLGLGLPVAGVAAGHLPWSVWMADHQTSTGKISSISLPDASALTLNTASAVNIIYTSNERRIRLVSGEIMITTRQDPRPFVVETSQGDVEALGTRFAIRELPDSGMRVSVFEHAVRIGSAGGASQLVGAGEEVVFNRMSIGPPGQIGENSRAWQDGIFVAQDMPLSEVLDEISRYRPGVLRCDPTVAGMRVSGTFPLSDTDRTLDLLAQGLPLRISMRTPYWVTVGPR